MTRKLRGQLSRYRNDYMEATDAEAFDEDRYLVWLLDQPHHPAHALAVEVAAYEHRVKLAKEFADGLRLT